MPTLLTALAKSKGRDVVGNSDAPRRTRRPRVRTSSLVGALSLSASSAIVVDSSRDDSKALAFVFPRFRRGDELSPMKRGFHPLASVQRSLSKRTMSSPDHPLAKFRQLLDNSWIQQLSPEDPENERRSLSLRGPSHPGRPVFNGHYVRVRPSPLPRPSLVLHSPDVLLQLGFSPSDAFSEPFLRFFSGDVDGAFRGIDAPPVDSWATPYALSIMGRRYLHNCPYGTGDGYGDGRAISVGEVASPQRLEMQLKGAGPTPFCRGADGRAVLRSSVREFLASEAMHHLGVRTTRALCLVVDEGEVVRRPWYSDRATRGDEREKAYETMEEREMAALRAAREKKDPDALVEEKCAITTRVATSFLRVGHFDLFARRAEARRTEDGKWNKESREYRELEQLMWHACFREYHREAYVPHRDKNDAMGAALALMEAVAGNIADTVAGWIRVGFVQGNFNADNCLVGGR